MSRLALLAGFALLQHGAAEAGAPASPLEHRAILSAEQLLELANRAAHAGDLRLSEAALVALTDNPDPKIRNEARFRLAMLRRAEGHDQDAALLFRRILDAEPDATRVRLELAATLQKLGDQDAALRELRALRTSQLPPNLARFIDRASASLQASKPFGIQLELAMAPDSNINRATRSDTLGTIFGDFDISQDARKRSGLGLAARALVNGRLPVADQMTLTGRATGNANLYRRKDFNDLSLEFSVGPEFQLGRTRVNLEGSAGQQWYGMRPFQRTARLSLGALRSLGPVTQIRVDGAYRLIDNRFNDLQDGHGLGGLVRLERALSPILLLSASIGADRLKARDDAFSTTSWTSGLTAYRDLGRMTLTAGFEVGRLKADKRLVLLPEARRDKTIRLQTGAVFRQLTVGGFAPISRIIFERNKSSVEYYDYRRIRTEIGISRAF